MMEAMCSSETSVLTSHRSQKAESIKVTAEKTSLPINELWTKEEIVCYIFFPLYRKLSLLILNKSKINKIKVFATDRGGPQSCEMLRIPHCLDN
jgi:hypothetical protein